MQSQLKPRFVFVQEWQCNVALNFSENDCVMITEVFSVVMPLGESFTFHNYEKRYAENCLAD